MPAPQAFRFQSSEQQSPERQSQGSKIMDARQSVLLPGTVIGLCVNRYEFGTPLSATPSTSREHDLKFR